MRAKLRPLAIGVLSLFVVLAAVAYVIAPSKTVVELSVQEVGGAVPFERDLAAAYTLVSGGVAAKRRYRETIYGSVSSSSGVPISRVRMVVRGVGHKVRGHRAKIWVGRPGTFRSIVHLRPGKYRLNVLLRVDGRNRKVTSTRWLRNRRAYKVTVRVRESGIVTMLPISSY